MIYIKEIKFIYGPVPSRRLGISLGVSPIPKKTCNYSCIYCQLGRTTNMSNTRQMFFSIKDITNELNTFLRSNVAIDVITIVGEGEPTLYLGLGELISEIHCLTDKPVAVITNGALLYDNNVRLELCKADIVLPSMDASNDLLFKKICRPYKGLNYEEVIKGLEIFSKEYNGQLWIEIMLMKGINDDIKSLNEYARLLKNIDYYKLYLNTPIRPPSESYVEAVDDHIMEFAANLLKGISINLLISEGFHSEIKNHYQAIMSIISRHPMNQFEIEGFLKSRKCGNIEEIFSKLKNDKKVIIIVYKGYTTYRFNFFHKER